LGLLFRPESLIEAQVLDANARPLEHRQVERSKERGSFFSLFPLNIRSASQALNGEQLARLAVLLTFCDPFPEECLRIATLSNREWKRLLRWLDLSSLTLYFLDRLLELGLCDLLPSEILKRLNVNLLDNTERTHKMISESIAIQREFQNHNLCYALLKGLSLWPCSVQRPELRVQFDLDFLVDERSAPAARRILERRGYRLYSMSARTWEFKLNERPGISLKDIYKDFRSYAVELHVESNVSSVPSPLERLEWRELQGMRMPVLSPVDLFMGQGLHVFKHICGESSRTSHMLEFRRHVLTRRDDHEFWNRLRRAASESQRAPIGLGVVTLLIARMMGAFAPQALTSWTADNLPRPVRLWVEMYGHRVALGSYPGDKLYLLLQSELEFVGPPWKRSVRRALLPFCLPPPAIRAIPNESLRGRIHRYSMHFQLILVRLRFHIVEGLRFVLESRRWRRMKELAQ